MAAKEFINRRAFTLAETLAALAVSSIVLIVVLAIYSRAQTGATGVINKLETNRLSREILQRISEDLDRLVGLEQDVQVTIENKFQNGFAAAKMEITRTINNAKNEPQTLEKIVWQSNTEPDNLGEPGLVLYRSHSGITFEDKLLDRQKEPWERELFVPICSGLTFFRIEVPQGETLLDRWSQTKPPAAITVTLSFAQPYKTLYGTLDVPEQEKVIRTIAIDRTRKLAFTIPPLDVNQLFDVNELFDTNQPAEPNEPNQQLQEPIIAPPPPPPG
jgi:type II secretory pathway pseudopilin PulG